MEKRPAERIIVLVYSVYALALMFASTILGWPGWIAPITSLGMVTSWIVYLRQMRDYRFRALLYSAMVLTTFVLYNTQEDSFGGILTTYCAAVVVLSILDIPDIVIPEYIFSVLLIAYHGFFSDTIPLATTQEKIRSFVQILSVFAVVSITHHLIKKHEATGQHMRQMISDLQEAERSQNDFLVNVSQAFRTPVSAICGTGEMILQEEISDPVRENVQNIQTAGRDLLSMIGDVLDYSELESGKITLTEEPYHLTSTLNDVINMALAGIGSKNLELIVDCDTRIPYTLLGDERKLRRVILNLVNNAVKFTETGCVAIVISARPEQYGVNLCVKVQDTGTGIREEHLEKLFGSPHQPDMQRIRNQGGIGLGLAISGKIISRMNGFISVKSEPLKGSEFQFVVPQKIVDPRPLVTVHHAETIRIIFYIDTEKPSFVQIRDHYLSSIFHMMEGLNIRYRMCRNLAELKRRMEKEHYTHALIAQDEYLEDTAYFDALSSKMEIIMIQNRESAFVPGGNIRPLHKPFYALSFAAILNGEAAYEMTPGTSGKPDGRFTAPEVCVLVVDDNLMNLKVAEGLLRPYRIKVVTASSGEECLSKLEKLRCDMIFMDHMMPEMDGMETVQKIRKKAGTYFRNVPVIALTANAVDGAKEMFLEEGFQDYISKPIEITHLEKVLRKYIPAEKLIQEENPDAPETNLLLSEPQEKKMQIIDREKGIRHMGGSPEDYEEVLQVYLEEGQEVLQELQNRYAAEDWKNYVIYAHSLKSNSFGIGADTLGEMAKALELAGKEGDTAHIQAHHAEMIRLYEAVLEEISGEKITGQPEGRERV